MVTDDKKHQKPFILRVRPAGHNHWTWELCRRGPDRDEPVASCETWSQARNMASAEKRARHAMETFLRPDQVEVETFEASPKWLAQLQKETNIGKVREMKKQNEQALEVNRKMASVRDLMKRSLPQIAHALPNSCTPERMMRVVATAIQKTPRLLDCTHISLIAAVMECAQLGLEPNTSLGHAYLIPFRNGKTKEDEVQMIPGYPGLVVLALRSGEVVVVHPAQVVYEKDTFAVILGLTPGLKHTPFPGAVRGEIIGAYATAQMRGGVDVFAWMPIDEINEIRDVVLSKITQDWAKKKSPWVTSYARMCAKTAVRRLCKSLPGSALQQAISKQDREGNPIASSLDTLLEFDTPTAIDVASSTPTPEPTSDPSPPPVSEPSPPVEPPPTQAEPDNSDDSEPDPTLIQVEEYTGMLSASDNLTYVDKTAKLIKADDVLTDTQKAGLLQACKNRRDSIRAQRGDRSNAEAKS